MCNCIQLNVAHSSLISCTCGNCKQAVHKTLLLLKSVGVLAGMRPCGVIVLLGELFISESKAQVYGYLHNFFAMHPDVAKCIAIVIMEHFFVM